MRHAQISSRTTVQSMNLFGLRRHGLKARYFRLLREWDFAEWPEVTGVQRVATW